MRDFATTSRFEFASGFDEIIDSKTGHVYMPDPSIRGATMPARGATMPMSLVLPGRSGNRILIVAGTRDSVVL